MNGGRQKWVAEGRPLTTELKEVETGDYSVPYRDASIRAFAPDVLQHIIRVQAGEGALVDVRSREEFTGERLHMPDYPNEGALRGGHVRCREHPPRRCRRTVSRTRGTVRAAGRHPGQGRHRYRRIAAEQSQLVRSEYLLATPGSATTMVPTEWGNMVGMPV